MSAVLLMGLQHLLKMEDGQIEAQRIFLSLIHALGTVGLSVSLMSRVSAFDEFCYKINTDSF